VYFSFFTAKINIAVRSRRPTTAYHFLLKMEEIGCIFTLILRIFKV